MKPPYVPVLILRMLLQGIAARFQTLHMYICPVNKNQKNLKFYYYGNFSVITVCNSKKVSNFAPGLQGSSVCMPFLSRQFKNKNTFNNNYNEQN